MRPVFILCVGAQKAGTSWLHAYVASFPGTNFGALKEYHVWDARHHALGRHKRIAWRNAFDRGHGWLPKPLPVITLRKCLQSVPGAYAAYFRSLTLGGARRTGDFTPLYSVLSAPIFAEIRRGLERVGFSVKVVFLMREPVARCLSAAQMEQRRRRPSDPVAQVLESLYRTEDFRLRTDYPRTIAALEAVFEPEQIYLGHYESMFRPEALEAISQFLEVDTNLGFVEQRVNASSTKVEIPHRLAAEIKKFYGPVYDYCLRRFPELDTLWTDC